MRKNILLLMVFTLLLSGCAASEKGIQSGRENPAAGNEINQTSALRCEWPEYDVSVSGVNVIFTNPLNENFSTGEYYELQVKNKMGRWKTVPVIENGGFPAIEYILAPGMSRAFFVSFSFHDYDFSSGTYRILKDGYTAEFYLVDGGAVSAAQPYGVPSLEDLSADISGENCLVLKDEAVSENGELVESFLEKVQLDMNCQLRIVSESGGDQSVTDILYENGRFFHRRRTEEGVEESVYAYLITDGEALYLSNTADWVSIERERFRGNSLAVLLESKHTDAKWVEKVSDMTALRLEENSVRYKIYSPDGASFAALTDSPTGLMIHSDHIGGVFTDLAERAGLKDAVLDMVEWENDKALRIRCVCGDGQERFFAAVLKGDPLEIEVLELKIR